MVQKFYCERYLSIQSMLGKKEKKYQHFNIFDYTYLPKTDICLFFFLFFYEPYPNDNYDSNDGSFGDNDDKKHTHIISFE